MNKVFALIFFVALTGCSGGSDNGGENQTNKPSAPNPAHRSAGQDLPIPYFAEPGHQIRVTKKFEFNFSDDSYRGLTFHYGDRLQANEKTGDGRGCAILQSLKITDMGPIPTQSLTEVIPVTRDYLGSEVPDDYRFYGVKFAFTVVGSGVLYCFRHESLGPVTLDDFKAHFAGYLEFN